MTNVENVKKLEEQLTEARKVAHTKLMVEAADILRQLEDIGFGYELIEKNGKPRIGRPRKEGTNGVVHEGKLQPKT
jgi:hypothetical protein